MQTHCVDICVVEDDANQRKLLVRQLRTSGYSVAEAATGTDGLRAIYDRRPRIILCDLMLPDLSGIQVCRQVRADPTLDGTYFVVMTGHDTRERRHTAFAAGADDYLLKPCDFEQLKGRIRSGMRFHRLQERLHHMAITDGLTGLANHNQFREQLDREFLRTRRYGGSLSLIMVDLDHFKAINDTFGHEAGNAVLKHTARHLQRSARETDVVARYGGEEFAIICPATGLGDARQLAERVRASFGQYVRLSEHPQLVVKASMGVAGAEDSRVNSVNDLINLSDQALYHSKCGGRDRVTVCDAMSSPTPGAELQVNEIDRLRKEVVALSMKTKELCLQSVWALIQALEARDGYSAWHSRNVTLYAQWLVEAAGWTRPLRVATTNAAMLHDLGKIGIPDTLLLKPRVLDQQEAALMRQVPLITCRILEPLRVFETEILIIRHVRENFDGSGYPDGLVGASIPIGSRMLAVAEAFDSLTCNRAYRPGRTIEEAVEEIRRNVGTQFDPEFVALLGRCVDSAPRRWREQIERARVQMPAVRTSDV
jgi:diguanylate cyclase (GGDEF)-like protein